MPQRRARPLALAAAALLLAALLVGLPRVIIGEARADERRPAVRPDWVHVLKVITALNAEPPKVPVVYLLGGSSARECTVSDDSWAAEVRRRGGLRVRTYNLGSNGQTYAQDITIVNQLPAVPSIVLIGVGLGRYMQTPVQVATGSGEQPVSSTGLRPDARVSGRYVQHLYSVQHLLTNAEKRQVVKWWLTGRYPIFKKNFAGNAAELDQLITACQARDLHPVLVEMPLNRQIVRHAFDKPRITYRDSCRAQAKKYGIPKINFLNKVHLVNGDFFDLFHLVDPGWVKWQRQLSKTVIALLKRYDMGSR